MRLMDFIDPTSNLTSFQENQPLGIYLHISILEGVYANTHSKRKAKSPICLKKNVINAE